ncbi:hypothetical protein Pint_25000 [Pistacia integerrima]|uniref:Uncharacterized protein n=1 Tax=Pistacia integerrima TaxID=434235 RepID=A0ACC0YD97_9ROSI|nr:hypothetical protein Pint_25000 [Pistacia integerrima]
MFSWWPFYSQLKNQAHFVVCSFITCNSFYLLFCNVRMLLTVSCGNWKLKSWAAFVSLFFHYPILKTQKCICFNILKIQSYFIQLKTLTITVKICMFLAYEVTPTRLVD